MAGQDPFLTRDVAEEKAGALPNQMDNGRIVGGMAGISSNSQGG